MSAMPLQRAERLGLGALVGALSGAVTLGIGEAVAAFVRPEASPVLVVGNRFVELTPESVKRWAIRNFGTQDKHVLLTGIYVIVGALAIAAGVLAVHRLWLGLAAVGLLGAIGVYAALTTTAHRGGDVVPTVIAAAAGAAVLTMLVRLLDAPPAPGRAAPVGPPRRRFLQGGAAAAGLAALSGFGGRAAQHSRFDVASARAAVVLPPADGPAASAAGTDLAKSGQPWQTPNTGFYRIDTALSVPQVDPNRWSLRIHGMVDREITLSYAQLLQRPLIERWITLNCVSNEIGGDLVGNALFRGARLAELLREAGVHADADQLLMTSVDGMTIGAPTAVVMDGRDALVAVGMNRQPLPVAHGFPARIVVPGLYGYVSACKWVLDIEATTYDAQQAYWIQEGWQRRSNVELASRIDTPRPGGTLTVGRPAAIAGVAWDQHVGVSGVEVQVDGGAWLPARLASVPSTDTWRQWVLAWTPPAAGSYHLRVRAIDARGNPQDDNVRDPFPAGATGLHTITVRAR
jgi:DMSO/TMAO reductase YedYZ molybdopterin-dependent catalytic subunit